MTVTVTVTETVTVTVTHQVGIFGLSGGEEPGLHGSRLLHSHLNTIVTFSVVSTVIIVLSIIIIAVSIIIIVRGLNTFFTNSALWAELV